jgi:hypothetical protein
MGATISILFSSYKSVNVKTLPFSYTGDIVKENYYVREL